MPFWFPLKKSRSLKLFLVFAGVIFLGVMFLRIYGNLFDSVPHKDYESIKNYYREELAQLKEMNQELSLRLSQVQEKVGEIVRERDSLQEDKSQLLFMLEKLEKQSNVFKTASTAEEGMRKFAQSWLMRISDLKSDYVKEGATARDALVDEVNEIVKGLKEDFSRDTFISTIDYCTITSNVKKDIVRAKKKLGSIGAHLREYYPPRDD
jgi:predicted RNase H-like nuclease (RuvC/YqgF family)